MDDETPTDRDLDYTAWTIIANVSEGDWSKQTQEWQDAATRWRDAFHASLDASRAERHYLQPVGDGPGMIEGGGSPHAGPPR